MSNSGVKVRGATSADWPALKQLLTAMHAESPRYRDIPLSYPRLKATIAWLLESPTACLFVAEKSGEVVGAVGGMLSAYFFSEELIASDLIVYIAPAARDGFTAKGLIQVFEAWAWAWGASEITLGISTDNARKERYARFYEKLGYHVAGNNTVKRR